MYSLLCYFQLKIILKCHILGWHILLTPFQEVYVFKNRCPAKCLGSEVGKLMEGGRTQIKGKSKYKTKRSSCVQIIIFREKLTQYYATKFKKIRKIQQFGKRNMKALEGEFFFLVTKLYCCL